MLKAALPLFDNLPVFLDHPPAGGAPSVRNLAGTVHNPCWSEQYEGILLTFQPGGPAAEVLVALHEAAMKDPAILSAVGLLHRPALAAGFRLPPLRG